EVERAVRMQNGGRSLLSYEDKNLYAENLLYAENTLFDIFDFPLLTGNPESHTLRSGEKPPVRMNRLE
ncbi:MAG TPA: hypothetical protein VFG50_13115, partial [Rhodothermales bacterium]|nr:hypothetical protein [Rhodothermales bacterium]